MPQLHIIIEQADIIRLVRNLHVIKRDMQPQIARMRDTVDQIIDSIIDVIPPEALHAQTAQPVAVAPVVVAPVVATPVTASAIVTRAQAAAAGAPAAATALPVQAPPIVQAGAHVSVGTAGAVAPGAVQGPGTSSHVDQGSSNVAVVDAGLGTDSKAALEAMKKVGLGAEITDPSVMGQAAKAQMEHPIAQPGQPANSNPVPGGTHTNVGTADVVQTRPAGVAPEPVPGSHVEAGDVQPQGKDLPPGSHSNVGP